MAETPLVSIALCTYNGARYLSQQLDTLIAQTYGNIEIIAVDDCSTDGTHEILTQYAQLHKQIAVYKNKSNVGFARNFEIAFRHSKGEFLAFCDQDDLWHPDKIRLQVECIGDNQLIYHDSEFIDADGKLLSYRSPYSLDENDIRNSSRMSAFYNFYRGSEPEVFLLENCVSGHTILVRRSLLRHALPFDRHFYHDWWLAYVAVNMGTIDYIPECLVKYRRHDESATIKDVLTESQKLRENIRWLGHCLQFAKNRNPRFVKSLHNLYSSYTGQFLSLRLWWMLRKNGDKLFCTIKKSDAVRKRYINRFFWGIRTRDLWYSHIKKNPEKTFHA
ncbi:glycosyltransferase family 2 protein [Mucilaginibacter sp. FT3.2]|uniref:glycosyltransferase family 2 protein n=1 Tax=Mucilaginibacter sp. FT3.2 TaxID=2723090 RepID=UPI00160CF8B6|nr:glycosyltransferase family 2 protein [Mucilaginibacter sp. FT3.2]MBB6230679.1 glycosyltransferase involved in cell wall biosynthesis [Mucilaginibacter sp. FT3.2]